MVVNGPEGIRQVGHRAYVGGLWDEIGSLQFEFLIGQGLAPTDVLVDIACGSLRAGVHLIQYLEPSCYLGIDKEQMLIDAGLSDELPASVVAQKAPEFVVSSTFEFDRFSRRPDLGLSQSLFTHLTPPVISRCYRSLRDWVEPGFRLYATWFQTDAPAQNPQEPDDTARFAYTPAEMQEMAGPGWRFENIGDWGHPRGQIMTRWDAV